MEIPDQVTIRGKIGPFGGNRVYLACRSATEDFAMSIPTTAKYESGASRRSAFSWTFPGAPIRVNIPLDIISRLRAEFDQDENLANGTSGAEVGGVLLGHQETPTTLDIDDYIWVAAEERPARRYHLNPSELEILRSVYTSPPVGYFRTQSEDNLQLRDEEIGFVGEHFRDPTNVVLLIRTSPRQYTAGFFFWMGEGVFTPVSFMDFPLDAELLRHQAESGSTEVQATQPTEEKETTLPLPGSQLKQIEPAEATAPRTAVTSKNTPVRVPQRTLVAAGAVFAVLALACLSAFLLRDDGSFGPRQKSPAAAAAFPLQLEVEAQGNGLNIRWNPQSEPVTEAREGRLVILEADQRPRIVPLDRQQLASGHVYYRSSAERLQFQLEIVDNSGRVAKESVLALSLNRTVKPKVKDANSPAKR
jgi:hypothetical protein